jgi:hypothetical protein
MFTIMAEPPVAESRQAPAVWWLVAGPLTVEEL